MIRSPSVRVSLTFTHSRAFGRRQPGGTGTFDVNQHTLYGSGNVSERARQPPSLAISTVIFALRPDPATGRAALWLPLVRRIREPFSGLWALPGGPLGAQESLQEAAASNLAQTTGLVPRHLEQLYAFGGTDRAPTPRVVSIVYWALVRPDGAALSPQDENVAWFPAEQVGQLAFDHNEIVEYALWRLRNRMEYGSIAHAFLGRTFTLTQLREVYEAVLGQKLEPANFRRQLRAASDIEATENFLQGGRHRPPRLYRYTGEPESPSTQQRSSH